jgi:Na+/melibiose symporter-like transporter
MKTGIFLIGLILLAIGAISIFYFWSDYQNLSTVLGQIGTALDPALKQRYNNLQMYIIGSIVAMIAGFGLLIYGATSNSSKKQ